MPVEVSLPDEVWEAVTDLVEAGSGLASAARMVLSGGEVRAGGRVVRVDPAFANAVLANRLEAYDMADAACRVALDMAQESRDGSDGAHGAS